MMVVIGFYKRRPDLSHEEFIAYWRNIHGPMLRDTPDIRRYLSRYIQHDLRPNSSGQNVGTLEFDGMSEVRYRDGADRAKLLSERFFLETIVPDEANFIDMSATRYSMYSTPTVMFDE